MSHRGSVKTTHRVMACVRRSLRAQADPTLMTGDRLSCDPPVIPEQADSLRSHRTHMLSLKVLLLPAGHDSSSRADAWLYRDESTCINGCYTVLK
jgi:hypothetical protein